MIKVRVDLIQMSLQSSLVDGYDYEGGAVSMLALNGLFTLITEHNLSVIIEFRSHLVNELILKLHRILVITRTSTQSYTPYSTRIYSTSSIDHVSCV